MESLPDELWARIASCVHADDQLAWALTCRPALHGLWIASGGRGTRASLRAVTRSLALARWAVGMRPALAGHARAVEAAAENGALGVVRWLRSSGAPWDERACAMAAGGGHIDVLGWLRANGAPWDERACALAAEGGHVRVLEWLRANGAPWDDRACDGAAYGGHLRVLEWLRANTAPGTADATCYSRYPNKLRLGGAGEPLPTKLAMGGLLQWALAARPKTLTAAVVPMLVGRCASRNR